MELVVLEHLMLHGTVNILGWNILSSKMQHFVMPADFLLWVIKMMPSLGQVSVTGNMPWDHLAS